MEYVTSKRSTFARVVKSGEQALAHPRNVRIRALAVAAAGAIAVFAALGIGGGDVHAFTYLVGDGTLGPVTNVEPGANCVAGAATVATPSIYARNTNNILGDDAQYVRFRSYAYDIITNQPVDQTAWSAWSLARDNAPALFSGNQVVRGYTAPSAYFYVIVEVNFWQSAYGSQYGVEDAGDGYYRIDAYNQWQSYPGYWTRGTHFCSSKAIY